MKMMYRRVILGTIVWIFTSLASAAPLQVEDVAHLHQIAQSGDLNVFREYATSRQKEIGSIISDYKLQLISKTNAAYKLESGRRNLGLATCGLITRTAAVINKSHDIVQLEAAASNLLWIASWTSTQDGYGNLFIEARAREVAAVAVARLFSNTNFPLEKYAPWLVVTNMNWNRPERRANVLFLESDGFGYSPHMTNRNTASGLEVEWMSCRKRLESSSSPLRGIFVEDMSIKPREFLVPELGWSKSMHYILVYGHTEPSIARWGLESIYKFRRAVGFFPTNTVSGRPLRGRNGIVAGFIEAWWPVEKENIRDSRLSQIGLYAGELYECYVNGTLVDEATRQESFYHKHPQ